MPSMINFGKKIDLGWFDQVKDIKYKAICYQNWGKDKSKLLNTMALFDTAVESDTWFWKKK